MRAFLGQLRYASLPTSLLCLTLLAIAPQSAQGAYPDKPIKSSFRSHRVVASISWRVD